MSPAPTSFTLIALETNKREFGQQHFHQFKLSKFLHGILFRRLHHIRLDLQHPRHVQMDLQRGKCVSWIFHQAVVQCIIIRKHSLFQPNWFLVFICVQHTPISNYHSIPRNSHAINWAKMVWESGFMYVQVPNENIIKFNSINLTQYSLTKKKGKYRRILVIRARLLSRALREALVIQFHLWCLHNCMELYCNPEKIGSKILINFQSKPKPLVVPNTPINMDCDYIYMVHFTVPYFTRTRIPQTLLLLSLLVSSSSPFLDNE